MFKKIIFATAVLASSVSFAAPYIGGSVGVRTNTSASGLDFRGMPFSLFLGYGGIINQNLYLGGELFGTVGTLSLENNGLQSTYGYGLSILPGIMFSDHTMGYLRAGVIRTQFKPTGVSDSTRTGGQLGLGLQTSLTQNMDLRLEYDYSAFKSFSGVTNPRSDEFDLGLIYKFE